MTTLAPQTSETRHNIKWTCEINVKHIDNNKAILNISSVHYKFIFILYFEVCVIDNVSIE